MCSELGVLQFDLDDQRQFAKLSGDFNPIHLDTDYANRSMTGAVVVHGIHLLMRSLDLFAKHLVSSGKAIQVMKCLQVTFSVPAFLRTDIQVTLDDKSDGQVEIRAEHHSGTLARIEIEFAPVSSDACAKPKQIEPITLPPSSQPTAPVVRQIEDLKGQCGVTDLYLSRDQLAKDFPHIEGVFGARLASELVAMSRLVGMECPGRSSLFSMFRLDFKCESELNTQAEQHKESRPHGETVSKLQYEVTKTVVPFSLIKMKIDTGSAQGMIEAFVRPESQPQPTFAQVMDRVEPDAFQGQQAFIVGGSRGLGEATAKLIAAGGGSSTITYYRNASDAEKLAKEIRDGGGRCVTMKFDVNCPEASLSALGKMDSPPTQMYYFATPRIFVNKTGFFDEELYRQFERYYVGGIRKTCEMLRGAADQLLTVFYPSSSALDKPVANLAEYAAAKAAGEMLCQYLEAADRNVRVRVKRLPRIATDQTLSLIRFPEQQPVDVMLKWMSEAS
jgi:NAD(P)-dependent dehydrogenase (short-subunit alcohol dehydrogenase family)